MRIYTKLAFWLWRPLGLAHELCHFLAARAFGFRARLGWEAMTFHPDRIGGRAIVVVLAPSLAGLVVWLALCVLAFEARSPILFLLTLITMTHWQLMCWRDFYCAWRMWRNGVWPRDDEGPQGLTVFGIELGTRIPGRRHVPATHQQKTE